MEFLNKKNIKCNYLMLDYLKKNFKFEKITNTLYQDELDTYISIGKIGDTNIYLDPKLSIDNINIYSLDEKYKFSFENLEVRKDNLFERYYIKKMNFNKSNNV